MTNRIAKEHRVEEVMMRDVYCKTLMEMAEEDRRLVILDADLMNSMGMLPFKEKYPDRTFNCGVQEANMIGVAAGLSATGKIPFAHTFGPFATRRCFDQVFLSIAYAGLNVKIVGSDPGITAAYNGGTHMPFEDMGLMRCIPHATILEPVDSVMLTDLLQQIKEMDGLFYVRLLRKNAVNIYKDDTTFTIGKAMVIRPGDDLTIIASGILLYEALKAREMLKREGLTARVVNIFTLKPIDRETIISCAQETGAIVTAENHNVINGLGSAVSEVLTEEHPVPLERIGCHDMFGEVGPVEYLMARYGMRAQDIAKKSIKVYHRKKKNSSNIRIEEYS